jgi:hypothetical protein
VNTPKLSSIVLATSSLTQGSVQKASFGHGRTSNWKKRAKGGQPETTQLEVLEVNSGGVITGGAGEHASSGEQATQKRGRSSILSTPNASRSLVVAATQPRPSP